jgi:hypothetical protein
MPFYLQFLVALGQWAQTHQVFVLALSATLVVLLGVARLTWRASVHPRRFRP